MRVLVVKAHPQAESFCTALTEATLRGLHSAGHEAEVLDLYAVDFEPRLSEHEWRNHLASPTTKPEVAEYVRMLRWAEALVFVYPTWWSGPPAILLGWMQRVLIHDVAFGLSTSADSRPKRAARRSPEPQRPGPKGQEWQVTARATQRPRLSAEGPNGPGTIRGQLRAIRRLAIVTTHGSARWVNLAEGQVGKMQLLWGLRTICHPLTRTTWVAMYKLDHSSAAQRRRFLDRVEQRFARLS